MKHSIRIFAPEGDKSVAEWEVGDEMAIEEARQIFEEGRRKGWASLVVTEAGALPVEVFDPRAEEYVFLRPFAGG